MKKIRVGVIGVAGTCALLMSAVAFAASAGNVTSFAYDTKGNLISATDPLNHTITLTYNQFGQPASVTDPLNQTTQFGYDAQGNFATATDPLGNVTQRVYDAVSRLVSLTDPRGFSTQFRYDDLNRLTEIADARQKITRFAYDPNGNLLSVTDAKGQITSYAYDNTDRLASRTDALGRIERYEYDKNGNLVKFTDRKGQVSTFAYDAQNQRVGASYANGRTRTYTYDAVGRLASVEDSFSGRIDFIYDILDRLTHIVTPQGVIEYRYDAIGRRTRMTVAGQQPVTYTYDAASRLTQVAQGSQVITLGYDAAGRRTVLAYSNGTTTTYGYDAASRLTSITHAGPLGLIESVTYAYDAGGNRTSINRANGPALLSPSAMTAAAYDVANQQIQFNAATLTYDANGNLTSDGVNSYTWDALNQLEAISGSGLTASFTYDALGRRIIKTVNGVTTSYLYDGFDIVQEIVGGAVSAAYLRSLNIDEPFVRQSASGNEFYHADALGSTLALTNAAGTVTTRYSYEPFGKTTITGNSSNPFQYTGRENDGTGLYYYRARYYDPTASRFTSRDPLGFPNFDDDPTLYAYVSNNPVTYADSYGLAKDKKGLPGQQGRSGPLSADDTIITKGKAIADKQGPQAGADYIKKQISKGVDEFGNPLSSQRKNALRAAAKVLATAVKRGIQIGGLALGVILSALDPAEAHAPTGPQDIGQSKSQAVE